eukprot:1196082-Prorocentrum_minimum.AAC.4
MPAPTWWPRSILKRSLYLWVREINLMGWSAHGFGLSSAEISLSSYWNRPCARQAGRKAAVGHASFYLVILALATKSAQSPRPICFSPSFLLLFVIHLFIYGSFFSATPNTKRRREGDALGRSRASRLLTAGPWEGARWHAATLAGATWSARDVPAPAPSPRPPPPHTLGPLARPAARGHPENLAKPFQTTCVTARPPCKSRAENHLTNDLYLTMLIVGIPIL